MQSLMMQNVMTMPMAKIQRPVSILDQIKTASDKKSKVALVIGCILCGFPPAASFLVAHFEVSQYPWMWVLVIGFVAYSFKTVYDWSLILTKHWLKAIGLTLGLEAASTFSHLLYVAIPAVTILVGINAIAGACALIMDTKANRQKAKEMVKG